MMLALGGRKFILTLIAMAVGAAIELKGPHGLSGQMAALLTALVGAFSVANVTSSNNFANAKSGDALTSTIDALHEKMEAVQASTALIGETLVNASKGLPNVNKR